ncbi:MAG: APC family permease [Thermoguttaceae bacterium]
MSDCPKDDFDGKAALAVARAAPRRQLSLFDSTCIIVGIIVGAGIYCAIPNVAQNAPNAWTLLGLWIFGGILSLVGALCYAELATMYPREGGDYVYLTRAFGRTTGFLFAWSQLWVVRPGSIGAMAYAFAEYANRIWPRAEGDRAVYVLAAYASGSILLFTGVNMLGVREGKWTQNVLTVVKLLGLATIVVVGLSCVRSATPAIEPHASKGWAEWGRLGAAMIFILFTFGGWNEMAYVGAEVRNPRKNILRALLIGTLAVTAVYALVNAAFLHALGFEGLRGGDAPAADVLELGVGRWAGQFVSLLIAVSALGAINGQIFTGSRIYYAMGTEHRMYAWLGRWNARRGGPIRSLAIQGAITLVLTVWFGLSRNGFSRMVIFTTPVFWLFLVMVGASVYVLRRREPNQERPFRTPGYPITPAVFCLSSASLVGASLDYALRNSSWEALWAIAILAVGVVVAVSQRNDKKPIDGAS